MCVKTEDPFPSVVFFVLIKFTTQGEHFRKVWLSSPYDASYLNIDSPKGINTQKCILLEGWCLGQGRDQRMGRALVLHLRGAWVPTKVDSTHLGSPWSGHPSPYSRASPAWCRAAFPALPPGRTKRTQEAKPQAASFAQKWVPHTQDKARATAQPSGLARCSSDTHTSKTRARLEDHSSGPICWLLMQWPSRTPN